MGKDSGIQWTDHTFNIIHGCQKVSEACDHCYAEKSYAVSIHEARAGVRLWGPPKTSTRRVLSDSYWDQPRRWNAAAERDRASARVFCSSLADVFEDHPIVQSQRQRLWPIIEQTPWLDWQLLTKRPQNIMGMVPSTWRARFPGNVMIGTTVETQARAEERVPILLKVPAPVWFLSLEPLLEEIDLSPYLVCQACGGRDGVRHTDSKLSWVIVGGESGPKARPFDLAWARSLRDQCAAAEIPFFVKQLGRWIMPRRTDRFAVRQCLLPDGRIFTTPIIGEHANKPHPESIAVSLCDSHGGNMDEWPSDLLIREFPRNWDRTLWRLP